MLKKCIPTPCVGSPWKYHESALYSWTLAPMFRTITHSIELVHGAGSLVHMIQQLVYHVHEHGGEWG